jgi:hypothetical protein
MRFRATALTCSALIAMLLPKGLASAQSSEPSLNVGVRAAKQFVVPQKDGEFRSNGFREGAAIYCVFEGVRIPPPTTYDHCLRLGPLKLGMELYQLQVRLSDDKRILQTYITGRVVNVSPDGTRTVLIPLRASEVGGGQIRLISYLVALVETTGQVTNLQLSGKANEIADQFPFSGIKLGSPQQHVVDTLGFPSSVTDVPKIKGKLWSYAPFPFSIEIVDGVVYSLRIHRPTREDLQRTFKALTALPD